MAQQGIPGSGVRSEERMFRSLPIDDYEQVLEDAWMRVSRTETRFAEFGGEIREVAMHEARKHLANVLRSRGRSLGRAIWTANGRKLFSEIVEIGLGHLLVRNPVNGNEVWVSAEQVQS
jgi:hypothetical protein